MITKPETTPLSDMTDAAMSGTQADIVDLLRLHSHQQAMIPSNMMRLAADEIERLRARVAELEAGLRKIADAPAWGAPDRWESAPFEVRQLARALLKGADE